MKSKYRKVKVSYVAYLTEEEFKKLSNPKKYPWIKIENERKRIKEILKLKGVEEIYLT